MGWTIELELILRLVLAAALGYIIGLEREFTGHQAGDRTFALTALGAALFAVISRTAYPDGDPARIAAGVVSGLGFLGAGTILRRQEHEVRGLTTAAGIWTVGAIGLAVGSGLYLLGIVAAMLTLFLLAAESLLHIDTRIQAWRERHKQKSDDNGT